MFGRLVQGEDSHNTPDWEGRNAEVFAVVNVML